MTADRPIDDFWAPEGSWHNPVNCGKRIRELSDRVSDLELAVEKLQAKNADDARTKGRVFSWGGWK